MTQIQPTKLISRTIQQHRVHPRRAVQPAPGARVRGGVGERHGAAVGRAPPRARAAPVHGALGARVRLRLAPGRALAGHRVQGQDHQGILTYSSSFSSHCSYVSSFGMAFPTRRHEVSRCAYFILICLEGTIVYSVFIRMYVFRFRWY